MSYSGANVTVVGAGIGGIVLAIALQQRGMRVQVCEQAERLDEIGAGIALSANGTRHLAGLGLTLDEHAARPSELILRDGLAGEPIARHKLGRDDWYVKEFGAPYYGIHRKDLQRILIDALAPGTIRLGRRLEGLTETPTGAAVLHWADGTSSTPDIVVGADGVRSTIRGWMTGAEHTRFSGTSGFRGVVPRTELVTLPDPEAIQFWVGDGAHLLHFPIGPDRDHVNFLAVVENPHQWPDRERWRIPSTDAEALAAFTGWHPAVTEMIGAVQHTERWGLFGVGPLDTWSKGNVVLMGDAAHGMLPHQGQGANQSIEDAVALAAILSADGDAPLARRFAEFRALREPRTQRAQRASWVTNHWLHIDPNGAQRAARDALFSEVVHNIRWLHEYDVTSD